MSIGAAGGYWAVGDFTNDGYVDLIDYTAGTTYQGRGDGTFTKGGTISLDAAGPVHGAMADLNGDGVLDFVSAVTGASVSSNGLGVLLANPSQASAVQNISASTQSQAQALLTILETAMSNLKSEQSRLGGLHERLDQAVSTNLLRADSIDEARENANSTDLALESANLVRFQILQQAQVAVLAQANFSAQLVTELLKF